MFYFQSNSLLWINKRLHVFKRCLKTDAYWPRVTTITDLIWRKLFWLVLEEARLQAEQEQREREERERQEREERERLRQQVRIFPSTDHPFVFSWDHSSSLRTPLIFLFVCLFFFYQIVLVPLSQDLKEFLQDPISSYNLTIEGLRAKRAYIEFWPIFIFCRTELIFGRLTCFDMKSIVP